MKYDVTVLAEKCQYDHACISDRSFKTCSIKDIVSEKVLFVNCERHSCNYCTSFGFEKVCFCPTRKELNLKYKI